MWTVVVLLNGVFLATAVAESLVRQGRNQIRNKNPQIRKKFQFMKTEIHNWGVYAVPTNGGLSRHGLEGAQEKQEVDGL